MKVMVDLNVLLDVYQIREPHYKASSRVLSQVFSQKIEGFIPAHGVTTLYYVIRKQSSKAKAGEVVSWLLEHFAIAECNKEVFLRASQLDFDDYEDAVVAAQAELSSCDCIITRDKDDFAGRPSSRLRRRNSRLKASRVNN